MGFEETLMTIQLPWAGMYSTIPGCSEPQFGLRNPGIHKGIHMISPHWACWVQFHYHFTLWSTIIKELFKFLPLFLYHTEQITITNFSLQATSIFATVNQVTVSSDLANWIYQAPIHPYTLGCSPGLKTRASKYFYALMCCMQLMSEFVCGTTTEHQLQKKVSEKLPMILVQKTPLYNQVQKTHT